MEESKNNFYSIIKNFFRYIREKKFKDIKSKNNGVRGGVKIKLLFIILLAFLTSIGLSIFIF